MFSLDHQSYSTFALGGAAFSLVARGTRAVITHYCPSLSENSIFETLWPALFTIKEEMFWGGVFGASYQAMRKTSSGRFWEYFLISAAVASVSTRALLNPNLTLSESAAPTRTMAYLFGIMPILYLAIARFQKTIYR